MNSISGIRPTDGFDTYPSYQQWTSIVPLPPWRLQWSVGGATLEEFLVVAEAWAQVISRHIPPDATVLEIGCGCGRATRLLLNHPFIKRFIGFDVIAPNIEWCNAYLRPAWWSGTAEFYCYDLYSAEYNPDGAIRTTEFQFPCEDAGADIVIGASIFTHLLEPDMKHYLRQCGRILSSRGRAILSIHTAVSPGSRFEGNEARIDMEMGYFLESAAEAGLIEDSRLEDLAGQQVVIFRKA